MRILRPAIVLACSFCLWAKTPLTHELMFKMKRVGAPAVSPDGRWVVFSVVQPAYDPKQQSSDFWIVAVDGSSPARQLTHTKAAESGAAWSADSKRIAFSTKRDGDENAQVYVLPVMGGEAERVTNHTGGLSGPAFSPDGKHILFQGDFDPLAVERKERKWNARVFEGFPVRHWDHWLDEKRPHVFVQDLTPDAKERDLLAGTKLSAEPGFDGASGSTSSDLQPVWTPESDAVVFTATVNQNQSAYAPVITSLYRVPITGGEPERITDGVLTFSNAYFPPNGKSLYATYEKEDGKVYHLTRVAKMSWPSRNNLKGVTDGLDRSVSSFGVSSDGKTLYALCEEAGHEKLYRLPAEGGVATLAVDLEQGVFANLSLGQGAVVANYQSSTSPLEVVRLDPGTGRFQPLTNFNSKAAAEIDWQPAKHFWFVARNGRKIHSMMFLPPGFNAAKKYPLIQFIHGGPHTMSRDEFHTRWNYHLLTAPGYVVLTSNYTGSTGFGEAFAQAIQGDPLKGPGAELNEAVDEALRQFSFLDGTRVAAGGASYGGHLANWLEATTKRYRCLFSHAGLIDLQSQWGTSDGIYHREVNNGGPVWEQGPVWKEQSPIRYAANFQTPMFLSVGEQDFRVPLNQTLENWSVLQRRQIASKLLVFPDENHWILKGENNKFFFEELQKWLARYLQ